MRKILLIYCSFVIACVVVIVAFITATTYTQLAAAILLYPVLVFFAYKVFPGKFWTYIPKNKAAEAQPQPVRPAAEKLEEVNRENIGISDIDKRVFLKLIGGAGLFFFFFSLFNKRAEGLLFKYLPGSFPAQNITGSKIDLAQSQPMDGYRISEIDDNIIAFYGFTNTDGAWFVMRADADTGSFRYAKGDSNFPGNWANRENLRYDYYSNTFKAD